MNDWIFKALSGTLTGFVLTYAMFWLNTLTLSAILKRKSRIFLFLLIFILKFLLYSVLLAIALKMGVNPIAVFVGILMALVFFIVFQIRKSRGLS